MATKNPTPKSPISSLLTPVTISLSDEAFNNILSDAIGRAAEQITKNAEPASSKAWPTDKEKQSFSTIRQGTSTNALTKLRTTEGKGLTVDSITGDATIKSGNIILTIPNYTKLADLKTSTFQLLDAITITLTETGSKSPTVTLPLADYMKRRGLKDRKEARKQLTADLNVLLKTSLTWTEKRGKSSIPYAGVNLSDSWMWADGKKTTVSYTFGQTFFNVLLGYTVMPYPAQLQTLNSKRNPNSYYFLRKITEHKNMNIGKKNEDIIAVKTLLAASPYIPSLDEVMNGNRHISERIINPFERDMSALSDTLTWEYCHTLNTPLTDTELQNMSYDVFEGLLIHTIWNDYPDQTERLERKAQRIAKAEAKGKTTSKKKASGGKKKEPSDA